VHADFGFMHFFFARKPYDTEGRTDRQTDRQASPIMLQTERRHRFNNDLRHYTASFERNFKTLLFQRAFEH